MASPPYGSAVWYKYTSTGVSYLKEAKTYPGVQLPGTTTPQISQFIGIDYNNDKKTDLALITSTSTDLNQTSGNINIKCFININGDFKSGSGFSVTGDSGIQTTLNADVLPIFVSPTQMGSRDNNFSSSTLEVAFAKNNKIHFFTSSKNALKDNLITAVTTGEGVVENITYSSMNPVYKNNYNSIYNSSIGLANYPNIDIRINSNLYLVSKLEKQSSTVYKKRVFAYYGAVVSIDRNAFVGFRAVSQSDWHDDSSVVFSKVYNNNIDLRGTNINNFTVPYMYHPYDEAIASDFVKKTVLTYDNATSPLQANKVFKLINTSKTEEDSRYGTVVETKVTYNSNRNPLTTTIVTKENGNQIQSLTESFTYFDPPSAGKYFIDFPTEKRVLLSIPGKTSEYVDYYDYDSDFLFSGIIKESPYTYPKREMYVYDSYGNVKEKWVIAPSQGARMTSYDYDTSGRFLTKVTDSNNLQSLFEYNPVSGMLTKETNSYGSSKSYTYDSWFKKLTVKEDQLNATSTISYSKSAGETVFTTILKNSSEGVENIREERFDDLGRKVKSAFKDLNGIFTSTSYQYDIFDRNFKISEPYFGNTPSQWNTTEYDIYGRPTQTILFNNKIVTTSYNGLQTTTSDGQKNKTIIKNGLGKIVSSSENGSTAVFSYFEDGNLRQSSYNGTNITMEQDGWGNRTNMTDPSIGTFTYTYNAYGELVEETSQNGSVVTTLVRDDNGIVTSKIVEGSGTNSATIYTYDDRKLPVNITYIDKNEPVATQKTVTKIKYDTVVKRPLIIEEEKIGVSKFTRVFTYDILGRISTETKTAQIGAKISSIVSRYIYKNGKLFQIQDSNNRVLWQVNTINAKGQILESVLGNEIKITNTFDSDGYLSMIKHEKTTTPSVNILTLSTFFDKNNDNLTSRVNSSFADYTESFEYDSADRLLRFTNKAGDQETQNYDLSGKITENNLGTYDYDAVKKYQNTGITISPETTGYYANRQGIFNDSMEDSSSWTITDNYISLDKSTAAHSGKTSLKITNISGVPERVIHSDKWIKIDNSTATSYTFSVWAKSDGPQTEMFLFMKTENEQNYFTQISNVVSNVVNEWTELKGTFIVPANIKKLNVRLDNNGIGNVWFDDIVIRKTDDPVLVERKLNISYNAFKSPIQIEETNIDKISFTYNDGNNRSTMYYGSFQSNKEERSMRKHYSADGSMEIRENRLTNTFEFITYIGGNAYNAPIVVKSDGDGIIEDYLYLHRDYQGTIMAVTNSQGVIIEKRLFDAWGNIIKVVNATGDIISGLSVLDRGYTGHEHLSVGLINMNTRIYDPILRRFLQADNVIQDPTNTQNYNRYGYVLNNPTKFVDPTGNYFDPPTGTNHHTGDRYDEDGDSWEYSEEFQTWFGLNGTRDITVNAIALNEVIIPRGLPASPPNGFYGTGLTSYSTDNTWGMTGYNFGGNYKNSGGLKMGFDVSGFKADFGNYSSGAYTDLRAKVTGVEGSVHIGYGNKIFNQTVTANGTLLSAEANLKGSALTGQNGKYGINAGFDLGAYAAKGDITGDVNIMGATFSYTYGGSVASAHAGGEVDAHWNNQTGVFHVSGMEHAGLGVGELAGLKISVPFRAWYNFFLE